MIKLILHPATLAAATAVILAGCANTAPSTNAADGETMNTPTVAEVIEFLESKGHSPKLEADDAGDPQLIVNEDGDIFLAAFYDCSAGGGLATRRCTGLEFSVTYPANPRPTLGQINRLNREYRMAKAYVNDEGNPGISVTLNTGGAFTRKHLEDGLVWWIGAMRTFEEDIGWRSRKGETT